MNRSLNYWISVLSLQKRGSELMSRVFTWKQYEVEITKKKVKRINIRIKPSEPRKIHMSIPYQVTYDEAMKLLDQPRNLEFIEIYEKK